MAEELQILETVPRLSQSAIWRLQRRFYEARGPAAWGRGGVPSWATSSPFVAASYLKVVLGFLRDLRAGRSPLGGLDPSAPVHVIELGAGHGRFTHAFLQELDAIRGHPVLAGLRVRYLMTDVAQANLAAAAAHPAFRGWVDGGSLAFASFDVGRDAAFAPHASGGVEEIGGNPLIVIANYVFDSVPHDCFRVSDGALFEDRVSVVASGPAPASLDDPGVLPRCSLRFDPRPASPPCYDDRGLDLVLDGYRRRLSSAHVAIPVAAIRCLKALHDLSGGRFLVLAADKGMLDEDQLEGQGPPAMMSHAGAFSLPVNFHALTAWLQLRGGSGLLTRGRESLVKVAALLSRGPAAAFPETRMAFRDAIDGFGPGDFFRLVESVPPEPEPPHRLAMDLFRLSRFDPHVLCRYRDVLVAGGGGLPPAAAEDMRRGLETAWTRCLPLPGSDDVAFEIGRVLYEMGRDADALRFWQRSLDLFGEDPMTFHNMGLSHWRLRDLPGALRCFDAALARDPEHAQSRAWRLRVAAALAREAGEA